MFVDVPMSVFAPPKMDANDNGISSFDGATPIHLARLMATGMSMTTTGVLFMNAESTLTAAIIAGIAMRGDERLAVSTASDVASPAPVAQAASAAIPTMPSDIAATVNHRTARIFR